MGSNVTVTPVSTPGGQPKPDKAASGRLRTSRTIALVGPFLSGKTRLLEAIMERTGRVARSAKSGPTTIGDTSVEAREHSMSIELNIATTEYLDDSYTFIDCPGSVEFRHEATAALAVADAAVVVFEPDPKRIPALQIILRQLEELDIPHMLFLNKIDAATMPVREILPMLQPASGRPLVLRQIPIWENGIATGFIDLALERAFVYREHAPSTVIEMPAAAREREREARYSMLERLADYDDVLMDNLLSDIEPPRDQVFDDLARELSSGKICPVLLGSAGNGNGILRLLKAIRHEVPFADVTAARLGVATPSQSQPGPTPILHVIKTLHTPHGGKLSVARVLAGEVADGAELVGPHGHERISGIFQLVGPETSKRSSARMGDVVAFGRLERAETGDTLAVRAKGGASAVSAPRQVQGREPPAPVYSVAIALADRKDEVKLSAALAKLTEEDPSLTVEHAADSQQLRLHGQGEMHVRVALERLERKYAIKARVQRLAVPFRESIRKATKVRGRHKKQSGGHGQFGDCVVEIEPLPRGTGFRFQERIVGGAIPRQYIPSVEIGVTDAMRAGPLGFPVVDVMVTLVDGSYHSVDSSDMAFRQAGRIAMAEGLPQCQPVLLEPVMAVEILTPVDGTAKVTAIVAQRRGQILRLEPREGWEGWDCVAASIPQAEMEDLIVDIRSATSGVGTFKARFDHLAELTGKLAEHVLQSHPQAAE